MMYTYSLMLAGS